MRLVPWRGVRKVIMSLSRFGRGLLYALASTVSTALPALAFAPSEQSSVEVFELPQTQWPSGSQIAVDHSGAPWVMANNRVFTFDGGRFISPTQELTSGQYLTQLVGGPDRGLYASQPGEVDHQGKLYRLDQGAAQFETTFYYDAAHDEPGLYVSKNGRLFNWGERFLAVWHDHNWQRIEASFGQRTGLYRPTIIDLGDEVYFYVPAANEIYSANATGELVRRPGPQWLEDAIKEAKPAGGIEHASRRTAAWNGPRVVVALVKTPLLLAFDVRTGDRLELPPLPQDAEKFTWCDAANLDDGTTWLVAFVNGRLDFAWFQLTAEARLEERRTARNIAWSNTRLLQYPRSVVHSSDGTLILGLESDGLAVLRDDAMARWNWRHGFPEGVDAMVEGIGGELWIALPIAGDPWCAPSFALPRPLSRPRGTIGRRSLWCETLAFGATRTARWQYSGPTGRASLPAGATAPGLIRNSPSMLPTSITT